MLVFVERIKSEYLEKKRESKAQPTYDAAFGNRTGNILVAGERAHHCASPTTPTLSAANNYKMN